MVKKEDRQQFILHEVSMHSRVLQTDLAHLLNVSVDTVRRDIKELHDEGKLKKVHGGAISNGFHYTNHVAKEVYAFDSKVVIAKKAVKLIGHKNVVLISGGTTNQELVKHLPAKLNATFFTPSLSVAIELMAHPNIEVVFIGGRLSHDSQITIGGYALNMLSEIKVDLCFLGTGYLDPDNGLTEFDWEVVQMKKAMISASKKVVSLSISEKLSTSQRYKICAIHGIHTLITELDPASTQLDVYRKEGVVVL